MSGPRELPRHEISCRRGNTVGPRCNAGYAAPVIGVGLEALEVMCRCQNLNCRHQNDTSGRKNCNLLHSVVSFVSFRLTDVPNPSRVWFPAGTARMPTLSAQSDSFATTRSHVTTERVRNIRTRLTSQRSTIARRLIARRARRSSAIRRSRRCRGGIPPLMNRDAVTRLKALNNRGRL